MKTLRMKYIIGFAIVSCHISAILGQNNECNPCNTSNLEDILEENMVGVHIKNDDLPNLKDDKYSHWNKGVVILANGDSVTSKIIRYDGVTDNLLVKANTLGEKIALDKNFISEFVIYSLDGKVRYRFKKIKVNELMGISEKEIFLQVLTEGKTSLYAYRKLNKLSTANELCYNYTLFLIKEDNSVYTIVKPSKYRLLSILNEKKNLLKPLLRKNHIRIRNEEQLVTAIKLANTL